MRESTAYIIEDNLNNLYTLIAEAGHLPFVAGKDLSWVNASPNPWPNYIFNASFSASEAKARIETVNDLVENNIAPAFWIKGPKLKVPNFTEILSAYHFRHVMAWPGMAINLKNVVAQPGEDFEIMEVKNDVQFHEWVSISQKVLFPNQSTDRELLQRLVHTGKVRLLLGYREEKAAGTVLIFLHAGVAGFFMVATLPEHRRNGLSRSMMMKGLQIAHENNCLTGVLQANSASQNLYKSIGFQEYCIFDIYWKIGMR